MHSDLHDDSPGPGSGKQEVEPDYDHLPRGEDSPIWAVAIAIGILLGIWTTIIAFS